MSTSRPRVGWLLLWSGALGAALAGSQIGSPAPVQPDRQMPPVTFRVEINYVEVDAVVVDKGGEFVADLRQGDFQVLEDGKPQPVSTFGLVRIPAERPEAPLFVVQPIEPDVQSNVRPFNGRVYLLVLDELHTSPLHSLWVRAAAREFIQTAVGANDVAAVVSTQGTASQEFTGSKRLLLAAVDTFMGNALQSATLNRIGEYNMRRQRAGGVTGPLTDPEDAHRAYNASATLDSIRQLSEFMAGVRGRRKAMVLFSEGIDYDINDVFNNPGATQVIRDSREAIAAATRANVSVYTVDPRGLTSLAGVDAGTESPPADADPGLGLGSVGMQEEMRLQQDSLRTLADETGGFASINSNDFADAFDRIQRENSSYYVLGYYPTNERRDGRFRKIEVRVNRPGVEVRARKGYAAPAGRAAPRRPVETQEGTPPILRDLFGSPLSIPGIRLTASAAPFKGSGADATVRLFVYVDGRDIAFTEKDGKYEGALDLAVAAIESQTGTSKGGLHFALKMPLQPATYRQVGATGLRVVSSFAVPPGRYQLRIGAADSNSQRVGSVHYDLDVPSFSSAPLTMSGLVLTSGLAAQVPTAVAGPGDDLNTVLPGPPTVSREFRVVEELALVAEIYDNEVKTPHAVDITTSLRSDDGRVVFSHEDQRLSSDLGGARGGYGHQARIPLKGMTPGLYVLKVEARSRLGKGFAATREVQFRIVR